MKAIWHITSFNDFFTPQLRHMLSSIGPGCHVKSDLGSYKRSRDGELTCKQNNLMSSCRSFVSCVAICLNAAVNQFRNADEFGV